MQPPPAQREATPFDDGELYDVLCGNLDYGIDYYLALARAAGGPVLDACCGTGRVTLPCLKAGVDADGLDLSPQLLERFRRKADALGLQPRLYEANMASFRLPRRYALVMITFNAFGHNLTTDDQIAALACCREHLLPGGLLALDGFFPGPDLLNKPDDTRLLEAETTHPATGLPVRVYDTHSLDRVEQLMQSLTEVEMLDAAGRVTASHRLKTTLRWIYKHEMALLLRASGFRHWAIYGGFDRRPLARETDLMIVEARP